MTSALVITADDLGIDPARDDGIFVCYARSAITQASLMVRGRSAESAARAAARIGLPLGLHLDLTETPPSADPASIKTLLGPDGQKLGKHGLRVALEEGRIDPVDVAREARAQIARFDVLVGAPPAHVDGHQHAHTVPALAAVLAPVFAACGVRTTRIPEQREVRVEDPDKARFYRQVAADGARARTIYAAHGVRSTEAFVGLDLMGRASSPDALRRAVEGARAASIELMAHPGYVGTGVDGFNESTDREHELRVLCSAPFDAMIAARALALTSFAALP